MIILGCSVQLITFIITSYNMFIKILIDIFNNQQVHKQQIFVLAIISLKNKKNDCKQIMQKSEKVLITNFHNVVSMTKQHTQKTLFHRIHFIFLNKSRITTKIKVFDSLTKNLIKPTYVILYVIQQHHRVITNLKTLIEQFIDIIPYNNASKKKNFNQYVFVFGRLAVKNSDIAKFQLQHYFFFYFTSYQLQIYVINMTTNNTNKNQSLLNKSSINQTANKKFLKQIFFWDFQQQVVLLIQKPMIQITKNLTINKTSNYKYWNPSNYLHQNPSNYLSKYTLHT
eukprot:TRINITY_DN3561_c0_g1_i4.p1 TRINITY_DN3561_c0_g1~~TRINITY_DN3561_c0_g1_i4.p1  ORF type:complete len:311 (-),score=-33.04 TRINITY_DN3561_c0_g1_i4:252-1100(-)